MSIADIAAGDKPEVRKLVEFAYPEGVTLADADKLGPALAEFLKANDISTRPAVIGLPARWLVVKSKDVPPTDPATLADMLRLQAEGDFSSELKDLIYDYAGSGPVLLVATQQKHVSNATAVCEAAGLNAAGVTSSAMALAGATGGDMVLAVNAAGSELTASHGTSIKHLRAPATERAFVGELRRAVSTIPANGTGRELVLWDGVGLNATSLSGELGFPVRSAALASMGVKSSGAQGDERFAPAVAVALAGLGDRDLPVDFLHSKLAVTTRRRIPRWAWLAVAAAVLLVAAGVWAYQDLARQEADLIARQAKLKAGEDTLKAAEKFVTRVKFAQAFHYNDPRYVACLRDLTEHILDDDATICTRLSLHEAKPEKDKPIKPGDIAGEFFGKTTDQQLVTNLFDELRKVPALMYVERGESRTETRRDIKSVSFSIKFVYHTQAGKAGK
jgi:hypothetical protein